MLLFLLLLLSLEDVVGLVDNESKASKIEGEVTAGGGDFWLLLLLLLTDESPMKSNPPEPAELTVGTGGGGILGELKLSLPLPLLSIKLNEVGISDDISCFPKDSLNDIPENISDAASAEF